MLNIQTTSRLMYGLIAIAAMIAPLYAIQLNAKQSPVDANKAAVSSSSSFLSASTPRTRVIRTIAVGGDDKEYKVAHAAASTNMDIEVVRKAAEAGDLNAINRLGESYEDGDGVAPDLKMAYACYERAATIAKSPKDTCVYAVINQARCLFDGIGCGVDVVAAHSLLKELWDKGFVEGALCLAYCRANGVGCTISNEGDPVDDIQLVEDAMIASDVAKVASGEDDAIKDVVDWFMKKNFGITWMVCGICGGSFICQDEKIHDRLEAPCCSMHFHRVCAKLWLKKYKACPGCKTPVYAKSGAKMVSSHE